MDLVKGDELPSKVHDQAAKLLTKIYNAYADNEILITNISTLLSTVDDAINQGLDVSELTDLAGSLLEETPELKKEFDEYIQQKPCSHTPDIAESRTSTRNSKKRNSKRVAPTTNKSRKKFHSSCCEFSKEEFEKNFFKDLKEYFNNDLVYGNFLKCFNLLSLKVISHKQFSMFQKKFLPNGGKLYDDLEFYLSCIRGLDLSPNDTVCFHKPEVSYHKLPESYMSTIKCSGSTPLSLSVLNDSMVAFSLTNASESYFVPHHKNNYEEALFKCEDARYDLDMIMSANEAAIELFTENIKKMENMSEMELDTISFDEKMGGESSVIYRKALEQVYGPTKLHKVLEKLHNDPLPIMKLALKRLIFSNQEWTHTKKAWDVFWDDINKRNAFKALDHRGLIIKQTDKKKLASKCLLEEMDSRWYENQFTENDEKDEAEKNKSGNDFHMFLNFSDKVTFRLCIEILLDYLQRSKGLDINPLALNKDTDLLDLTSPNEPIKNTTFLSRQERNQHRREQRLLNEISSEFQKGDYEEYISSEENDGEESNTRSIDDEIKPSKVDPSFESQDSKKAQLKRLLDESFSKLIGLSQIIPSDLKELIESQFLSYKSEELQSHCSSPPRSTSFAPSTKTLYGSDEWFLFFKLFEVLYTRLLAVKKDSGIGIGYPQDVLVNLKKFLGGKLDNQSFEENLRENFGKDGFNLFTVDFVVQQIGKQLKKLMMNGLSEQPTGAASSSVVSFVNDPNLYSYNFEFTFNTIDHSVGIVQLKSTTKVSITGQAKNLYKRKKEYDNETAVNRSSKISDKSDKSNNSSNSNSSNSSSNSNNSTSSTSNENSNNNSNNNSSGTDAGNNSNTAEAKENIEKKKEDQAKYIQRYHSNLVDPELMKHSTNSPFLKRQIPREKPSTDEKTIEINELSCSLKDDYKFSWTKNTEDVFYRYLNDSPSSKGKRKKLSEVFDNWVEKNVIDSEPSNNNKITENDTLESESGTTNEIAEEKSDKGNQEP